MQRPTPPLDAARARRSGQLTPPLGRIHVSRGHLSQGIGSATNSLGWSTTRVPYDDTELRTPSRLKGGTPVTPGFVRERRSAFKAAEAETASPMKRTPDLEGISRLVPKIYRRVDIKYSHFGVEDFDFQHYNRTNFCGLEIHIPNAYCNAMLQVFYFLAPMRQLAQASRCCEEHCILCELGYLFHMLNQVPGRNCQVGRRAAAAAACHTPAHSAAAQASNFLRAFRTIPEATMLKLVFDEGDSDPDAQTLQAVIQSWHRFMLTQFDYLTRVPEPGGDKRSVGCAQGRRVRGRARSCPAIHRRRAVHRARGHGGRWGRRMTIPRRRRQICGARRCSMCAHAPPAPPRGAQRAAAPRRAPR